MRGGCDMSLQRIFSLFLSNAILLLGATALQRAAALALIFFAAQRLSVVEFGTLAYVYTTATTLSAFIADGFAAAILRFARPGNESTEADPQVLTDFLLGAVCCAFFMALVVFGFASVAAEHDQILVALFAAAIAFLLALNGALFAVFSRHGKLRVAAPASAVGSLVVLGFSLFATPQTPLWSHLLAAALGLGLTCLSFLAGLRFSSGMRFGKLSFHFPSLRNERLKFLWKTGVALALGGPVHWLCLSMLHGSSDGAEQVAVFALWFQWYLVLVFVPTTLIHMTLPWLSAAVEHAPRLFARRVLILMGMGGAAGLALMLGVMELSGSILAFYPSAYAGSANALYLAVACGLMGGMAAILMHAYLALGKVTENLLITLFYSSCYLILSAALVWHFKMGAQGLFIALLSSILLQFVCQALVLRNRAAALARRESVESEVRT